MKINKMAKEMSLLAHASLTPEQRKERAQKAAQARWGKHRRGVSTMGKGKDKPKSEKKK